MISLETTKEFQDAIKEEYGKEVTIEEAVKILADLVAYFDLLAKINHIDSGQKVL